MPAPNNKADRETLKALVRVKLKDGKTYRDVANEVGVSLSTIHRWNKHTVEPAEMEAAKNAITSLDLQTLSKTSLINHLVLDAILEIAEDDGFSKEDLKTLSRAGVDVSKIHGIHWDKVMLRDGTMSHLPKSTSPEQMILLLLANAEADRAKAASIQADKEMYEVMQEKGVIDL